jgi:hypothetical protein
VDLLRLKYLANSIWLIKVFIILLSNSYRPIAIDKLLLAKTYKLLLVKTFLV